MNTKHTSGPWIAKRAGFKYTIGTADTTGRTKNGHDYTVCVIDDNSSQAEANARLIAAAPDMLNALIEAKKLLESVRHRMPKSIRNSETFHFENILANVIYKSIQKATQP
jgi:hypothetical protein